MAIGDNEQVVNEKASEHMTNIETRLDGYMKLSLNSHYVGPLGVEGQVGHLIAQAVDIDLLAQMYIGWAAYL